jgi:hypothetical protein
MSHARERRPPCTAFAGALLGILLAGCATTAQQRREELAALGSALAGSYDNRAQAEAELRAGAAAAHAPLALLIARVQAPLVGDDVFFVRESALDDPRRVFSQRIWVLGVDESGRSAHGVYRFAEPERWRGGGDNPELFRALLPRDLEPAAGCDVRWSRTPQGFRGANDPATCRIAGEGGATLGFEQILRLEAGDLALSERQIDAAGVTVPGAGAAAPYLFRRQSTGGR